jgi:hypothetical protein
MLPLKAALLFSGKVLFFLKGRVFINTVILKILLLLMTDHFSISEPLKDLEQAALMPIDIAESKNQCKQTITNSASLQPWLIFREQP